MQRTGEKAGGDPPNPRAAVGMGPPPDMNNGGRWRMTGNGNAARVENGKWTSSSVLQAHDRIGHGRLGEDVISTTVIRLSAVTCSGGNRSRKAAALALQMRPVAYGRLQFLRLEGRSR